jgi:Protein of unknown function (DUF982)
LVGSTRPAAELELAAMFSRFSKPVVVKLGGGKTALIDSVELAREILLAWPFRKRGSKYRAAVVAIIEAEAPDIATIEQAFREAADEAGILEE